MLITDARCYSATDIFAAGFQDHGIGSILGVDANTGAGGANVWTHGLLSQLVAARSGAPSPYKELPAGVDMRVSIRRTLRVGDAAGTPVEDLGVRPDVIHEMTRADVEGVNNDLIARAVTLLEPQPVRRLDVDGTTASDGTLKLALTTAGMDRVDVYLDDRPVASVDVTADDAPTTVAVAGAGARRLRLLGYQDRTLVANRRESLGPLPSGQVGIQRGGTLVRAPAGEVPTRLRFLVATGDADLGTVRRQVRRVFGRGWAVEPLFDIDGADPPAVSLQGFYAVIGALPSGSRDERKALAFEMSRELMRQTGYDVQPDLPSGAMYPPAGRTTSKAPKTRQSTARAGSPGTSQAPRIPGGRWRTCVSSQPGTSRRSGGQVLRWRNPTPASPSRRSCSLESTAAGNGTCSTPTTTPPPAHQALVVDGQPRARNVYRVGRYEPRVGHRDRICSRRRSRAVARDPERCPRLRR